MEAINTTYDINKVKQAIETALSDFYTSLVNKLNDLSIEDVIKSKNPYLYKSKAMNTASEIVDSVLSAYVSSSEETIFGNCFFEPLAIAASGGNKSTTEGIDIEIRDKTNNRIFCIAVKSGTSVFNADSRKRQEENFSKAKKLATQGHMGYEPIIGYGYGQKRYTGVKSKFYSEYAGEDFWTFITGDSDFYKKIINFMGQLPESYVHDFRESYERASNRLTRSFLNIFCDYNGNINWDKLVEYNSGSLERQIKERKAAEKTAVIDLIKTDSVTSKKEISEKTGITLSSVNNILNDLNTEKRLKKIDKIYRIMF